MEVSQADLRIADCSVFSKVLIKEEPQIENDQLNLRSTDLELPENSDSFSSLEIKEHLIKDCREEHESCAPILPSFSPLDPNLNAIQHSESSTINSILSESFGNNGEQQITNYNISAVAIAGGFLEGLNLNIKKETGGSDETYSTEWLCDVNNDPGIKLKITKSIKDERLDLSPDIEDKCRSSVHKEVRNMINSERLENTIGQRSDSRERLRKKAERMRERRKRLYETESAEQRLERLAKEAAKRREMRMYYETSDQKRKRLDAEAARKREYRMYSETPDERRKRLDREAERRRLKRMSLYANETPEQKRERLNKESAKRREARLNQYAKESDDQKKERLKRDAIRAREIRFTRSAIESEDERKDRLVKDALRKRELWKSGKHLTHNFTELQTVRTFEELSSARLNETENHYVNNWMVWLPNAFNQLHSNAEILDPQPSKR